MRIIGLVEPVEAPTSPDVKKFTCPVCGEDFATKRKLTEHRKASHPWTPQE